MTEQRAIASAADKQLYTDRLYAHRNKLIQEIEHWKVTEEKHKHPIRFDHTKESYQLN